MDNNSETLRIEFTDDRTRQHFTAIAKCDASYIKSLIIQQTKYDRYLQYDYYRLVKIPETISKLVAVETIKINACMEKLSYSII